MAYEIPTEEERPVLFRWLKQQSSFTMWSQIGPYFDAWVNEFKRIPPVAVSGPNSKLDFHGSELRLMLTCRAAFVDALAKLRAGDQSVFKWMGYGTGQGYFCEAWRTVGAWRTQRNRALSGEELPLMDTPYWGRFEYLMDALTAAWGNGSLALQERHTDVPAPLTDMLPLRGDPEDPRADRSFRVLRDSGLTIPPIPTPRDELIIKTGDSIPCYGIWEPVKLDLKPGFAGLFKRPVIPADGKFDIDGCMNYLHAGSPAPMIAFEEDDLRGEGRPTVWRLLWRDDRYQDGTIPPEEAEYIFLKPDEPIAAEPAEAAPTVADLIVASSGTPAPRAGTWAAKNLLNVRVGVRLGSLLPQHDGLDIEWVHVPGV